MRHARVFLVEDEALIRLMLAEMVEELGYQIVAGTNAKCGAG